MSSLEGGIIRIHHECKGEIEKSDPMITDCLVMPNGDRERKIFLSHSHTNNGLFFLLATKYLILYWKKHDKGVQR